MTHNTPGKPLVTSLQLATTCGAARALAALFQLEHLPLGQQVSSLLVVTLVTVAGMTLVFLMLLSIAECSVYLAGAVRSWRSDEPGGSGLLIAMFSIGILLASLLLLGVLEYTTERFIDSVASS